MPVPTITSLNNAALDVAHISDIATSSALTATDRLGNVKSTVAGAVDSIKAFNNRGAWVTATAYASKDLVSNGGNWYVCVVAHTSGATFAADEPTKWRVYQGVTAVELALSSASSGLGHISSETGAVAMTVQEALDESPSIVGFGGVGDGTTNNDIAFGHTEALTAAAIYLPAGVFLTTLTNLQKVYVGPGVIKHVHDLHNLNSYQAPRSLTGIDASRLGSLTAINSAIFARAAKVVFWGDSITEGVSQIAYEDSYPGLIERFLKDQLPGVAWTVENYSIAGSSTADAASATYVGAASDSYPTQFYRTAGAANVGNFQQGTPLWPVGSTVAKTWRDHVKDSQPDLLVIAFGANETATTTVNFVANLQAIIDYVETWTSPPSIVLVSNLQPTRKSAPWNGYQTQLQQIADCVRGMASLNGVSLIDANRIHRAYRDGVDVCRVSRRLSYTFAGGLTEAWPTGWSSVGTLPTVSGTYNLTFSAPGVTEKTASERDVHLSAVFAPVTAASSAFQITYRSAGAASTDKYTAQVTTNAGGTVSTCILYYGSTPLASGVVTTVTNGENVRIDVECLGERHVVKVRGVTSIDTSDFRKLAGGQFGVQYSAGSGAVTNWVARVGNYRLVGFQQLSDDLVYGATNDWTTNFESLGGDAIHHPSAIGHHAIYYGAAEGLLNYLARTAQHAPAPIVSDFATNTVVTLAAGDYLDVAVNGNSNGSVMVSTCVADSSYGATVSTIRRYEGNSVAVTLQKNGVTFLTVTLALPGGGAWTVLASGSASSKSGTIRHTLSAVAFRQE